MDYLSNLPVDLQLQQLTYLPFDDVVNVCKSSATLLSYCSDSKYNNNWKSIVDNTFNSVYKYEDKLKKIWSKLNIANGTYNYLVYTQLIKLLDPLTQLMIYYRQNDTKSFNDKRFSDDQRFLSMFLLNKPEEMKKYKPRFDNYFSYYSLLKERKPSVDILNNMIFKMAIYGNVRGVKYMIEKGADIHAYNDQALRFTSQEEYIDVVKYLVEQGADIHAMDDDALRGASRYGRLDVVKYLVEQGADIHAMDDDAVKLAKRYGNTDVVKYLEEQGN